MGATSVQGLRSVGSIFCFRHFRTRTSEELEVSGYPFWRTSPRSSLFLASFHSTSSTRRCISIYLLKMSVAEAQNPPMENTPEASTSGSAGPIPLAQSSGGRVSGKSWKTQKTATVYVSRTLISSGYADLWPQSIQSSSRRQVEVGRAYGKDKEGEGHKGTWEGTQGWQAGWDPKVGSGTSSIRFVDAKLGSLRRREVTLERKKIAEEKKRIEEDKAKVGFPSVYHMFCLLIVTIFFVRWAQERRRDYDAGQDVPKRSTTDRPFSYFLSISDCWSPCFLDILALLNMYTYALHYHSCPATAPIA